MRKGIKIINELLKRRRYTPKQTEILKITEMLNQVAFRKSLEEDFINALMLSLDRDPIWQKNFTQM